MCQHILILGGDMRQYYMAKLLAKEDFAISYFGNLFVEEEEKISKIKTIKKLQEQLQHSTYEYVILPMPVGDEFIRGTDNELKTETLTRWLKKQKQAIVIGGKLPRILQLELEKERIDTIDFMAIESIAIMNGRLTAENAVIEAVMMSNTSVTNSNSLVIGYGRCGQMIASILRGMGSKVTVAEVDEEKAMLAVSYGYLVEELTDLGSFQFIFQTAPKENVITDKLLVTILGDENYDKCVILDISSVANSIDMEYAKKHQILCTKCPGLPGKYTARSAGELLGEYVKKIVKNRKD